MTGMARIGLMVIAARAAADAAWDGKTTASGTNRIAQAEEAERKARTK